VTIIDSAIQLLMWLWCLHTHNAMCIPFAFTTQQLLVVVLRDLNSQPYKQCYINNKNSLTQTNYRSVEKHTPFLYNIRSYAPAWQVKVPSSFNTTAFVVQFRLSLKCHCMLEATKSCRAGSLITHGYYVTKQFLISLSRKRIALRE